MCPAHFETFPFQKQQWGVVVQLGQGGITPGTSKHSRCPNSNILWVCNFVLSRDRDPQLEMQAVADCEGPEEGISQTFSICGGSLSCHPAPPTPVKKDIQTGEHFTSHHRKVLGPKRCLEPSRCFPACLVIAASSPSWPWSSSDTKGKVLGNRSSRCQSHLPSRRHDFIAGVGNRSNGERISHQPQIRSERSSPLVPPPRWLGGVRIPLPSSAASAQS